MIQELPTWSRIDATKLQEYKECPRKAFFINILGWNPPDVKNDKHFGTSWHKAQEHLLRNMQKGDKFSPAYNDAITAEAYVAFLKEYRQKFPEFTDEDFKPKTAPAAGEMLARYSTEYKGDDFDVLHVEVAGEVPLGPDDDPNHRMYFNIDAICRDGRGIFILDHKTTKRADSRWIDKWALSTQINLYIHVIYCIFPPEDVFGAIINVAVFKKEGEVFRIPVKKTPDMMRAWLANTLYWLDNYRMDLELLRGGLVEGKTTEGCVRVALGTMATQEEVMTAFPMNTQSCSNYWGCPYIDLCTVWPNPLKKHDMIPSGFEETYWDPAQRQQTAAGVWDVGEKGKKVREVEQT